MIEIECPMCEDALRIAFNATELRCEGCAITVDLVERFDVPLAIAA
jgi:hypothetical protein